jgi:hypothetical protein
MEEKSCGQAACGKSNKAQHKTVAEHGPGGFIHGNLLMQYCGNAVFYAATRRIFTTKAKKAHEGEEKEPGRAGLIRET